MKNPKAAIMIVISLVVGLIAVIMATQWVEKQAAVATNKVVVAKKDIDLGMRLTPDMLELVDWPRGSVPPGAITEKDRDMLLKDPKTQEARIVRINLMKGEPIVESKLAPVGAQPGLSFAIPEGKRAITVGVNAVVGVAGFALPGNYVDIVVNTVDEGAKAANKTISKIVLEHIKVLAVAQETSAGEGKPKVVNAVTLEVTPDQAEKIDLARSVGSLSLVLRNQMDDKPVVTAGVFKPELLKRAPEPEVVEAKPGEPKTVVKTVVKKVTVYREPPKKVEPKEHVEVIRGTARSSEEFKARTEEK